MMPFSSPTTLGIDIGTTKVAVAITNAETKEVVATASLPHESDVQGLVAGRSEQDVSRILSCLDACIELLPEGTRRSATAIGTTGQMHGVVLWNQSNRDVSHLVTWQDQRCLEDGFLARLQTTTGDQGAQSGYGTSTLAWLATYEPELLHRYTAAATIHDYLVTLISGNSTIYTDPSDAASFGFFDLRSRMWRENCIAKAGFPKSLLPTILPAGERVGGLSAEHARRWKMPSGIPVANAVGDNQASLFGSLTDPNHQIALTIGTGAQLSVVIPNLPSELTSGSCEYEFRPYVGNSYIAVVASLSGGRALAALGRALEDFMSKVSINPPPSIDTIQTVMHEQGLSRIATTLEANASLSGQRHDLSLRGSFTNLSFDTFTIGDMTAALSRGLVYSLKSALPIEFLTSKREVVGSGNAIRRSPLMQHIIRECFGCNLRLQEGNETTATGAALLAIRSIS